MTKRKILNITSTKKKDTMTGYTNSTPANQTGGTVYSTDPAIVTGGLNANQCNAFLWCATARTNQVINPTQNTLVPGNKFYTACRTDSNPYMVGLAEKIEIQCNSGMPWQWRRICWTQKGGQGLPANSTSFNLSQQNAITGWNRVMNQVAGNPGTGDQYNLFHHIFRGQVGSDWVDVMTAPLDPQHITVKYDKVITLASGNEEGFIRAYRRWHPMKKTLSYADEEYGNVENADAFSQVGKKGMGDYYVLDLFRARQGAQTNDSISIRPCATLYWHEK